MSDRPDYAEITVLIPGYTIEDLPSDPGEDGAESLLNAFAVAWHPAFLAQTRGIPRFRHSETLRQLTGRHILLIPTPTEDWMPHDWHDASGVQIHTVLRYCGARQQWLEQIDALTSGWYDAVAAPAADAGSTAAPADSAAAAAAGPAAASTDDSATPPQPVLVDDFLAFGTAYFLVLLLSRRMHHFIDPDEYLLTQDIVRAADAAVTGDAAAARLYLQRCFELLRETREKFYPLDCFLVDLCLPAAEQSPAELTRLLTTARRLNLVATASELAAWTHADPELVTVLQQRLAAAEVCLLTGHQVEVRSALVSAAALLQDLASGHSTLQRALQVTPQHWARRRFGLLASLPTFLQHFGFASAFHVALDDGFYPDRERSQFDWQAPDGAAVAATSRIPLAADSAVSVLRLPDRYNESMQDDTLAVLFLARLPEVHGPWLQDLRRCAEYAPVLGEFVTLDGLTSRTALHRNRLRFEAGEYLSPYLIQTSVLKTEAPVSGPASLHQLWTLLESCGQLQGLLAMLTGDAQDAETREAHRCELAGQLLELERQHADIRTVDSAERATTAAAGHALHHALQQLQLQLAGALLARLPQQSGPQRGRLIINTLPFARQVQTDWDIDWSLPAALPELEAIAPSRDGRSAIVRLPPGGFVWLTEATGASAAALLTPDRREPPLAEPLSLRNRHFEIRLSSRHGGIESLIFHQSRANRLSQHVAFRFEKEQRLSSAADEGEHTHYARTILRDSRILESGPLVAAIENTLELRHPSDDTLLAVCRQTTSVDRLRPRVHIRVQFDEITADVTGNPWMTYYGCRFAWDNPDAAISRSVLGQAAGFRGERIEAPDYLEVADEQQRLVIATYGRPWHRRSGPRMLDSLLICEGEDRRDFEFCVALDQPFPLRTALDVTVPPLVLETAGQIPRQTASSWLLGLSARNVTLVSVHAAADTSTDSEAAGRRVQLRLTLLETEGLSTECLVRTARTPRTAVAGTAVEPAAATLTVASDGVRVPLNAFQLKDVVLTF